MTDGLAWFDEVRMTEERSARIKAGMQRAREQGVHLGRPSKAASQALRLIVQGIENDLTLPKIAEALNQERFRTPGGLRFWTASHVRQVMKTQKYKQVKQEYDQVQSEELPSLTWQGYQSMHRFFLGPHRDVVLIPMGDRPDFDEKIARHIRRSLKGGRTPIVVGHEEFYEVIIAAEPTWNQYLRFATGLRVINVLRDNEFLCIEGIDLHKRLNIYRAQLDLAIANQKPLLRLCLDQELAKRRLSVYL
jgi:hypothetical protein